MKTIINGNNIRLNEPYETRDGGVVTITKIVESDIYPFIGSTIKGQQRVWKENGLSVEGKISEHDIINLDKYNDIEEMKTRPHKHADLIMKLAEMFKTDHEAWSKFQVKINDIWHNMQCLPSFNEDRQYRFTPETVIINGVECPKSVSEPLNEGQQYFITSIGEYEKFEEYVWYNDICDRYRLENNLIYLTPEEAITVTDALIKPLTEIK